jgi:hypothetical protein
MRFKKTPAIALVATVVVLGAAAGTPARLLSISNEQFRIVYNTLTFRTRAGTAITCRATFEGQFINRGVYNKTYLGQYGWVTSASWASCSQRIVFLTETLPWLITYTGFRGTLPNITEVETYISGFRFRWGTVSICLYESESLVPQPVTWVREGSSQIVPVTFVGSRINSGSFGCASEEMWVSGDGTATERTTTRPLLLTLIR